MKVTLPDGTVVEGTAEELSQLGYLPPAPPRNWDGSPKVTCTMNDSLQASGCTVTPERAAEIANMMFHYTDHTPGAGRLELTDNANDRVDADATIDTLKVLQAYAVSAKGKACTTKTAEYATRYVDEIPTTLEPGVLYYSEQNRVSAHLCACGCGTRIDIPACQGTEIIEVDGGLLSARTMKERMLVRPDRSIYGLTCKSHYFIKNGKVLWV